MRMSSSTTLATTFTLAIVLTLTSLLYIIFLFIVYIVFCTAVLVLAFSTCSKDHDPTYPHYHAGPLLPRLQDYKDPDICFDGVLGLISTLTMYMDVHVTYFWYLLAIDMLLFVAYGTAILARNLLRPVPC